MTRISVLIIVLLFICGGAACAIIFLFRKARQPLVSKPSCAKCGRPVEGLDEFNCPNCNADLREAGIATGSWTGTAPFFILMWTIAFPVLFCPLAGTFFGAVGPNESHINENFMIEGPGSKSFKSLSCKGWGHRVSWGSNSMNKGDVPLKQLTITIDGNPSAMELSVNMRDTTSIIMDGKSRGKPFDKQAVLAWWKASGIDTTIEGVDQEAQIVVDTVIDVAKRKGGQRGKFNHDVKPGEFERISQSGYSMRGGTSPWSLGVMGVLCIGLWIIGAVALARLRRPVSFQSRTDNAETGINVDDLTGDSA